MSKFEYCRKELKLLFDIEVISEMSTEGWSLISVIKWSSICYGYFKREKLSAATSYSEAFISEFICWAVTKKWQKYRTLDEDGSPGDEWFNRESEEEVTTSELLTMYLNSLKGE